METMGQRIRHLRAALGFTQQQLADKVGVSKGAISQWEGDAVENIKLKNVLTLCDLLRTDLPYLVYGAARRPANIAPFPTSETGKFRLSRAGRAR